MLVIPAASAAEVISYTSVAATTIQLVSVSRTLPNGLSPPYIAFEAQVRVYTKGALLPAHLHGLTFDLTVDTTYIATVSSADITINPYDQRKYNMEFQMNNPTVAATLAERNSNYIGIVMTTLASAGLHQQRIVRYDSAIWTRSG